LQLARNDLDVALEAPRRQARDIGDGDFLHRADVVDAQVLALGGENHQPVDEIVDVVEGAGLGPGSLDRKADRASGLFGGEPGEPQRELRQDVFPAHVGAVDVVRPEDQNPVEILAAVVDRQQFADDLAAAVGIARIQGIGHRERRGLVGRHTGRGLVDLGTGGEDQFADPGGAAGVEDVDHAPDRDVEDKIGLGVEELGAVDVGEMVDPGDALRRARHRGGISDVGLDHLESAGDVAQPPRRAARVVVEHAHCAALAQQALDNRRADEPGSAGDEVGFRRHRAPAQLSARLSESSAARRHAATRRA